MCVCVLDRDVSGVVNRLSANARPTRAATAGRMSHSRWPLQLPVHRSHIYTRECTYIYIHIYICIYMYTPVGVYRCACRACVIFRILRFSNEDKALRRRGKLAFGDCVVYIYVYILICRCVGSPVEGSRILDTTLRILSIFVSICIDIPRLTTEMRSWTSVVGRIYWIKKSLFYFISSQSPFSFCNTILFISEWHQQKKLL